MSRKLRIEKAEATGVRVVIQIVREWWNCGFQEYEARNDDGIDGLILIKRNGEFTGEIIHVQIKAGNGYRNEVKARPNQIGINVGKDYIKEHRPRWNNIVEPTILIYVDDSTDRLMPDTWWVNLKSDNAYLENVKSQIIIPKGQKFGEHSIGDIKRLYGTRHLDYRLPQLDVTRNDVNLFTFKNTLKEQAREFYKNWGALPSEGRAHKKLGEIIVNRVGWRHITRAGRKTERIQQSFNLLGVAKKMITEIDSFENFGHPILETKDDKIISKRYLGIRAFVIFPHRYESSVTVVLRNKIITNSKTGDELENKTWFYSIYESRRGRTKKYYERNQIATNP